MKFTISLIALAGLATAGSITVTQTGATCLTSQGPVTTGISVQNASTVTLGAAAGYSFAILGSVSDCHVSVVEDLITGGSPRPGFLTITLFGSGFMDGGGYGTADLLVNGVVEVGCSMQGSFCQPHPSLTVPVILGAALQVQADAMAHANDVGQFGFGLIQATVQIVEDSQQIVATPEPATLWLIGIGLSLLGMVRRAGR